MKRTLFLFLLLGLLLVPETLMAARINEISESSFLDRTIRFFTFQDPSLRNALIGSMLLGICCGLMGTFLVIRKLALMGDALSHAVLPGVAGGFLWNMTKDPVAIFIGASISGLMGAGTAQWIRNTTRLKEDAALGFVLAVYFGVGICLFTMIQNMPGGNKSGLDKFMFGQAAALSAGDISLLAGVCVLALGAVLLFFKEYLLTSFDPAFARAVGMPVKIFHYSLMLLLAFAIVASLQAVGVVLVSAMLVIPPAAAYLLTDRLDRMLWMSAIFGMCSGAIGAFFSFVGHNIPTGPFMVLSSAFIFTTVLFFAPRYGIVSRKRRQRARAKKVIDEHTLKHIYHAIEQTDFAQNSVAIGTIATIAGESPTRALALLRRVKARGWIRIDSGEHVAFTEAGWRTTCQVVRNHRLWELYLTCEAKLAADHVHDNADIAEHVLDETMVRKLEAILPDHARDPHGKQIPETNWPLPGTALPHAR